MVGFAGGGVPDEGDGFGDFGEEKVAGGEGKVGGPALGAEGGIDALGVEACDGSVYELARGEGLEVVGGDARLEAAARHRGGEEGDAVFVGDVLGEVAADAPIKPVVTHGLEGVAAAHKAFDGLAENFDEFLFGHEFVFGLGEGVVMGGGEGVGNFVGEPSGLEGGAGGVGGLEGLDEVVVVAVDLLEKGGALVVGEHVGGVVEVGTLALEAIGTAHALEVEDFFAAGEIFAAGKKLAKGLAGGLVEQLVGADDFAGEFGVFGEGEG